MTFQEFMMLLGVTFASAMGQILLRKGASSWVSNQGPLRFITSVLKGPATPAILLVLGAPLLYWKVLETVPLSHAYAVTAFTGVLVQVGGRLFLKEKPASRVVAGALLCCAGIALWGL